ncbi:MAG: hypothetical protein LBT40_12760 [Deltaproteobacteria bacterium]|jgi:hypothetical protein|nr:hypothetical protein [Deltaproteobacteria bacterium]
MTHDGFIAGMVTKIVPDPGRGPDGLPAGPLARSSDPKVMVCLDIFKDMVDPNRGRRTKDGVTTVEYRCPPPYHVIFRGEWAESISCSGLGVGDFLGATFTFIPWDNVTLATMARMCRPYLIPILGEGESPVIFRKGSERAAPRPDPQYPPAPRHDPQYPPAPQHDLDPDPQCPPAPQPDLDPDPQYPQPESGGCRPAARPPQGGPAPAGGSGQGASPAKPPKAVPAAIAMLPATDASAAPPGDPAAWRPQGDPAAWRPQADPPATPGRTLPIERGKGGQGRA